MILAMLMAFAAGCTSAASSSPSGEGTVAARGGGSSTTSSPAPTTAEYSRDGLSFRYPVTWHLELRAEGAGVARGCGAGFWTVAAQFHGEGFVSISRCPSTFVWPPEGRSIEQALRKEMIARNRSDLTSIVELGGGELGGISGIGGTITLDPSESTLFEIGGGANGILLRGATTFGAVDAGKPDIYEVACLWTPGEPGQVGRGCNLIISSFQIT